MKRPVRALTITAFGLALIGLLGACSGGDDDTTTDSAGTAAPTDSVADSNPDPFCAAMNVISVRLQNDPPDDEAAFIVAGYTAALPLAPPELIADLETLIVQLGGELPADAPEPPTVPAQATPAVGSVATTAATSTTAVPDTATAISVLGQPDEAVVDTIAVTPAEHLAYYLDVNCDRVEANPGPPATVPEGGFDTVPDTRTPVTSGATG